MGENGNRSPLTAASPFPSRRLVPAARLLRQIRDCRAALQLETRSDSELLQILNRRISPSAVADPERGLAESFAITDETIRRRLGSWRIFDPDFDRPEWAGYFRLAQSVEPAPAAADLDADEQVIVATLRRVLAALPSRYPWQINLPAAFYQALARKDTHNRLQFHPSDEQLLAAIHLYRGQIVEMNAGEGKTVAAAFPAILHARRGRAVHIHTANDYLAARDCQLLTPVYRSLGISAAALQAEMTDGERRAAYSQQIVYGALREFGFDFLRDNLKTAPADQVQSSLDVAIFDEADQALIDESHTPLIIAGEPLLPARVFDQAQKAVALLVELQTALAIDYLSRLEKEPPHGKTWPRLLALLLTAQPDNETRRRLVAAHPAAYRQAQALLYPEGNDHPDPVLTADLYYVVDPAERFVTLTARGLTFLESRLGPLYTDSRAGDTDAYANPPPSRRRAGRFNLAHQVHQLLRAWTLLKKDVDYIIDGDEVVLLDRYTGRPRPDTRYQDGLHPALEARAGITVHPDGETLARISAPGFARRYAHLSGMTGTAAAASDEFQRRYGRSVVVVPTSRPFRRRDLPSRVYANAAERLDALADAVTACRQIGQPVLVGVPTVAQSAQVSRRLTAAGLDHRLLNAFTGHAEVEIIRRAGEWSAVTVATNMAGRGADIILEPDLNARITAAALSLIQQRLASGESSVTARCPGPAETDLLSAALSADDTLSCARRSRTELTVTRAALPPDQCALPIVPGSPIEFGLGLYVLSVEFNESPRVSLQLQGRSGRQGQFGATRFLLAWDDPLLAYRGQRPAGLESCRQIDTAGRVYWEGKAIDNYLRRWPEQSERESAARRSIIQDYAAVADAHTDAYYQTRQGVLTGAVSPIPDAAALNSAMSRSVARHFPVLDTADYPRRFSLLAKEAQECYGIDIAELRGCPLDALPQAMADLLTARLDGIQSQLGASRFSELARRLWLQTGDELWKDYCTGLQALTVPSRLGQYGHKSAVADYIIHAADQWQQFQEDTVDRLLSQLLTFPLTGLTGERQPAAQLDERLSKLVG